MNEQIAYRHLISGTATSARMLLRIAAIQVVLVVVVEVGVSWMAKVCEGADVESPANKQSGKESIV